MKKIEHIEASNNEVFEVETIMEQRKRNRRNEYLVKWKGYDDVHNTWEPESNLENCSELLRKFLDKLKEKKKAKPVEKSMEVAKPVEKKAPKPVQSKLVSVERIEVMSELKEAKKPNPKPVKKLTKIRDASSKTREAQNKIEYQMVVEDTLPEEHHEPITKPLFDKKLLVDDKKYSTTKEIAGDIEKQKLTLAISRAYQIEKHFIIDGTLYFICDWTDKIMRVNYNKYCIRIDELETNNPALLLSYLKNCLLKEIN